MPIFLLFNSICIFFFTLAIKTCLLFDNVYCLTVFIYFLHFSIQNIFFNIFYYLLFFFYSLAFKNVSYLTICLLFNLILFYLFF